MFKGGGMNEKKISLHTKNRINEVRWKGRQNHNFYKVRRNGPTLERPCKTLRQKDLRQKGRGQNSRRCKVWTSSVLSHPV